MIIGPNASGKSNLWDSIRFLRDLATPGRGLQDAIRTRGGLTRVRCLFARNNNHGWVAITVAIGSDGGEPWTYSISVRSEPRGLHRAVVAEETVRHGDRVLLQRPDDKDRDDPERLTQTALDRSRRTRTSVTSRTSSPRPGTCTSSRRSSGTPPVPATPSTTRSAVTSSPG